MYLKAKVYGNALSIYIYIMLIFSLTTHVALKRYKPDEFPPRLYHYIGKLERRAAVRRRRVIIAPTA